MRKIRRRCACDYGGITNYGKTWLRGHHSINCFGRKLSKEHKKNLSLAGKGRIVSKKTRKKISLAHKGKTFSKETKEKISLATMGNTNCLGRKISKEHKLKIFLANIKYDPSNPYCDIWKDKEYKDDMRKDYCENINCKRKSTFLINHHIYLDKKRCAPDEIMTLCNSCHTILHRRLERGKISPAIPKDFVIINRIDHVSYIHKTTHKIIRTNKRG